MYRAGAAQRHAAAELRAGHAQHVAQNPQERRVAVDIDRPNSAIHFDVVWHEFFSQCGLLPALICLSATKEVLLPDLTTGGGLALSASATAEPIVRSCAAATVRAAVPKKCRRPSSIARGILLVPTARPPSLAGCEAHAARTAVAPPQGARRGAPVAGYHGIPIDRNDEADPVVAPLAVGPTAEKAGTSLS